MTSFHGSKCLIFRQIGHRTVIPICYPFSSNRLIFKWITNARRRRHP
nr:MAG TPA: hypothetical protein [Caudoviricetes sp.]